MIDLADLDPAAALSTAVARRRAADAAEAELLAIAAHWADLHAVLPGADVAAAGLGAQLRIGGVERLVPLAGEGTPEVAEFAPAELGAALGMTTYAAGVLVGNALELRHRLPRLWARVMEGTLPAWRACQVAEHTKALNAEAARFVDTQVAAVAHRIGLRRLLALVDAAVKRHDPSLAAEREKAAAETRGVWCSDEMTDGTRSIRIEADALDAEAFDQTITDIADALERFGDTDAQDVRRSKAVGVIADPQGTLDLLSGEPDTDSGTGSGSGTGTGTDEPERRRVRRPRRRVSLYVHLHEDALRAASGIARVEGLGAATLDLVRDWLGAADVVLRPVLDLADRNAVDAYETPAEMRETVVLRNPCCPFPWCNNLSRRKDMDHVEEFVPLEDGGPPGQTRSDNLAGLCRRHHRFKTHGGWKVTMPEPGLYLWRSPRGRRYLVDHTGTTALDAVPA
ncbi:MAG: DUF222 domain-containing protein [Nocardioides sp.]